MAKTIDLSDYSKESVELFAVYIETGTLRKVKLSFMALAELLKLSKAFSVEMLQAKLEEQLIMTVSQSAETVLEGILVAGITPVSRETESQLQYLAAWRFTQLARSPSFRKIPLHQFIMLLGSCELNVSHELVVADAALVWLVGQKQPRNAAAPVFSMIRAAYLSKIDKQLIFERISGLGFHDSVSRAARVALSARHNERVCLERTHLGRHLPRCGLDEGNDGRRNREPAMPLSRPRKDIKYSAEDDSRSVKKSKKSARSDISSKTMDGSTKSGKSAKKVSTKTTAPKKKQKKKSFLDRFFPKKKKAGSSEKSGKSAKKGKKGGCKSAESTKQNKSTRSDSEMSAKSSKSAKSDASLTMSEKN